MDNKGRKQAGFLVQTRVILWKNLLLYKRNKCGIAFECIFLSFSLVLLLLAYNAFEVHHELKVYDKQLLDLTSERFTRDFDVYYYPKNEFIRGLVKRAFENKAVMVQFKGAENPSPEGFNASLLKSTLAFISFPASYDSFRHVNDSFSYTIFSPETGAIDSFQTDKISEPKTKYMFENSPESFCPKSSSLPWSMRISPENKYNLFNAIKHSIDMSFINSYLTLTFGTKDISPLNFDLSTKIIDCPEYKENFLKTVLSFFIPMLICISYLVTFLLNVSSIIIEKETKVKEYLRLIGFKPLVITLCWMIKSFVLYSILSVIITVSLKYKFSDISLFEHTSGAVLFLTCIIYAIQCICLSILVGQYFSKTFWAKTISIILWLLTSMNIFSSWSSIAKYFLAIFPNSSLLFCFQFIFQYERSAKTLSVSKIFTNLFDDPLRIGLLWMFMLFWSGVYLLLSWYFERVFPGEYGVKLPLYFPFMRSYWFNGSIGSYTDDLDNDDDAKNDEETSFINGALEKSSSENKSSVKLIKLTKKFSNGFDHKTVVNNVTLDFYENQITGFLGHNGAGKTTVTFILCGLYAPSSGTARILGYDIRTDIDKIRNLIGYCPQINILYDELTCRQHLDLVCSVKGFSGREKRDEIDRIGHFIGLSNDLNKRVNQLSGGMKRRLQFGMSLIGDAKVIILDEPSSGLDPFNRRELWNLIKAYKTGRTIILTTHYMEEADTLSDRIAIINHGQIVCSGSPIDLKEKFGSGYRLIITKDVSFNEVNFNEFFSKSTSGMKPSIQSNAAREMTILVPSNLKSKLAVLLVNLERLKGSLGILNYGISSSTVEEVFLKVGNINSEKEISFDKDSIDLAQTQNIEKNKKAALIFQQVKSLFLKRLQILKSRYFIAFVTLVVPALILFLQSYFMPSASTLIVDSLNDLLHVKPLPKLDLNLDLYGPQTLLIAVKCKDRESNEKCQAFKSFAEKHYEHRPKIKLELFDKADSIGDYIYEQRLKDLRNLVGKYYVGIEFEFANERLESVLIHYSSMVYHSQAVGVNEVNSLLLGFASDAKINSIKTINWPQSTNYMTNLNLTQVQVENDEEDEDEIDFSPENIFSCYEIPPFTILDVVIGIAVSILISLTAIHITRERVNRSKSLQLMSGTHIGTYWLSNYLFDMVIYAINIVGILLVIQLCHMLVDDKTTDIGIMLKHSSRNLLYIGLVLFSIVFSANTLSYLWSNLFKSDIIAFSVALVLLIVVTFIDFVLVILIILIRVLYTSKELLGSSPPRLDYLDPESPPQVNTGDIYYNRLQWIRTILTVLFPNLNVKRSVYYLKLQNSKPCIKILNDFLKFNFSETSKGFDLKEPGIGKLALYNLVTILLFLLLLIMVENKLGFSLVGKTIEKSIDFVKETFRPGSTQVLQTDNGEIEEDVQAEADRIEKSDVSRLALEEPIVVANLKKVFKKGSKRFYAVNNLNFGVASAECFGLLGLNGAGKTTTIEIITGQKEASEGHAFLNFFDVRKDKLNAIANLGICPQFDYLPDFLTVKQTLHLFANIRGIKKKNLNSVVRVLIRVFQLAEFKNKPVQTLSGGTKRKLSAAIAMIGRPKTVILDEPTAGMDPAARRYIWNIIKVAREMGTTILLTTHSMEECEALCTRLGIMASGQFQCFGNIQNLKSKYGNGYSLILKCKGENGTNSEEVERNRQLVAIVEGFVKQHIPNAILKDKQSQTLFYQIELNQNRKSTSDMNIANMFDLFEQNKDQLSLETYSLSQTTLEQIFLTFANKRANDTNENDAVIRI